MHCPICHDVRMREVEKNGIMIDICPSCKGVWLDRGELEKLMSGVREVREEYNDWYYRNGANGDNSRAQSAPPKYPQPYYDSHPQGHPKHRKKKKSVLDMLGDLFD